MAVKRDPKRERVFAWAFAAGAILSFVGAGLVGMPAGVLLIVFGGFLGSLAVFGHASSHTDEPVVEPVDDPTARLTATLGQSLDLIAMVAFGAGALFTGSILGLGSPNDPRAMAVLFVVSSVAFLVSVASTVSRRRRRAARERRLGTSV